MKVLLVKTSSMGDVIHTLPAISDAQAAIPNIQFDWAVEEGFSEIPSWHPAVHQVIKTGLRHWRKRPIRSLFSKALKHCLQQLRAAPYDVIIDAQGLLKSALLARCANGSRHGFDKASARESMSARWYHHRHTVSRDQHAVERTRELFAKALGYKKPTTPPNYGIRHHFQAGQAQTKPYLVFLHNTTWESKLYPEPYWVELGKLANQAGFQVKLTSGNHTEKARADRIADQLDEAEALSRLSIQAVGELLFHAAGVISVDTGFGHLCAALECPNVSLYGPTNPKLTSAYGLNQISLHVSFPCAPCMKRDCTHIDRSAPIAPPCFTSLPPKKVWGALTKLLG